MLTLKFESFAFISDRYTFKFTEKIYETEAQNQVCNINMYMETGISNLRIWNDDPTKKRVLPLFQIATQLNSKKKYMKRRFRFKSET